MKNQWWLDISERTQKAYDSKDAKTLYHLIRQVFGPQSASMVPLRWKDGSLLHKSPESIMKRWTEHFTDLFYNPSVIDDSVVNSLPRKDINHDVMDRPTISEIRITIKELNTGKAPGFDGIPVEVHRYAGDRIATEVCCLISAVWLGAPVPRDWIHAIFIRLYKGKGLRSICGNYRGISLLEAVGKVFAKLLLDRLTTWVCPRLAQNAKMVSDPVVERWI